MPKRLDIEFIRVKFEDCGYILVSDSYINCHQKLDFICPNGHIGNITYNFRIFSGVGEGTPESFGYYTGPPVGWNYTDEPLTGAEPYHVYTTVIEVPLSCVPVGVTEFDVATLVADAAGGATPTTATIFDIVVKDNKVRFGNFNVSIESIETEVV